MIKVTVELVSAIDSKRNRVLGSMVIANDGTGSNTIGNYEGRLIAEYTDAKGRFGKVTGFNRQKQSVWSLVGAFLKQWGHTKTKVEPINEDEFDFGLD